MKVAQHLTKARECRHNCHSYSAFVHEFLVNVHKCEGSFLIAMDMVMQLYAGPWNVISAVGSKELNAELLLQNPYLNERYAGKNENIIFHLAADVVLSSQSHRSRSLSHNVTTVPLLKLSNVSNFLDQHKQRPVVFAVSLTGVHFTAPGLPERK